MLAYSYYARLFLLRPLIMPRLLWTCLRKVYFLIKEPRPVDLGL
jgi:hypothetical protein